MWKDCKHCGFEMDEDLDRLAYPLYCPTCDITYELDLDYVWGAEGDEFPVTTLDTEHKGDIREQLWNRNTI